MKKPVYLRSETWDYLQTKLNGCDPKTMKEIIAQPGSFLLDHDLLSRPDMLVNTVIEVDRDSGPEYLITREAAAAIAAGAERVTLVRLYDHHQTVITRAAVIKTLRHGLVFDQLDNSSA